MYEKSVDAILAILTARGSPEYEPHQPMPKTFIERIFGRKDDGYTIDYVFGDIRFPLTDKQYRAFAPIDLHMFGVRECRKIVNDRARRMEA